MKKELISIKILSLLSEGGSRSMKPTNKLGEILAANLYWDKRRIDCLVKILIALMAVQTVNLTRIANYMGDIKSKIPARYRRLQRFFSYCKINYDVIAAFIIKLFGFDQKKFYLTMDRTNWKWGKKDINVLFLGIVYKGTAIPIYWLPLNHKGNSNTKQRIALIKRFIKRFGSSNILGLLGDREFVGQDWFAWLDQQQVPFFFRVKQDAISTNSRGLEVDINGLFYGLRIGEKRVLQGKRKIYKNQLHISGTLGKSGELVIIVSNVYTDEAIETYCHRWEIETLFQCLKNRGFRFEETHMTEMRKIKKLIVLLAIAFCWAHKVGEWRCANEKQIKLKKHGRKEKNIFRYGLDLLQDAVSKIERKISLIMKLLKLLLPPIMDGLAIGQCQFSSGEF